MTQTTSEEPIAWGLFNPATCRVDARCYAREEAARAGAVNQTNRWRTFVAIPLFLARGEEFLEFKEALSDLRSLRQEHADLNGGGPDWSKRNAAAWDRVDELFAGEDEAAWCRQQEDAHG